MEIRKIGSDGQRYVKIRDFFHNSWKKCAGLLTRGYHGSYICPVDQQRPARRGRVINIGRRLVLNHIATPINIFRHFIDVFVDKRGAAPGRRENPIEKLQKSKPPASSLCRLAPLARPPRPAKRNHVRNSDSKSRRAATAKNKTRLLAGRAAASGDRKSVV